MMMNKKEIVEIFKKDMTCLKGADDCCHYPCKNCKYNVTDEELINAYEGAIRIFERDIEIKELIDKVDNYEI